MRGPALHWSSFTTSWCFVVVSQSQGQQYHELKSWWASLALGSRLPNIPQDGAISTPASPEHSAMEHEPVAAAHLENLAKDHMLAIQVWRGAHCDEEPAQHLHCTACL
jgi:hypothetical protein